MNYYAEYDLVSGRIYASFSSSGSVQIQPREGAIVEEVYTEANRELHYIYFEEGQPNALLEKEAPAFSASASQILSDGSDELAISGLPEHTVVQSLLNGEIKFTDQVDDGEFVFETNQPGSWTFVIDSVAHLKQEIEIEAISPN